MEREFNEEGKKHGIERHYFEDNGQLSFEIEYVNGKKNGIERIYHHNGELSSHCRYKDGQRHATMKCYNEAGELWRTVIYQNGRMGKEIFYKDGWAVDRHGNRIK